MTMPGPGIESPFLQTGTGTLMDTFQVSKQAASPALKRSSESVRVHFANGGDSPA